MALVIITSAGIVRRQHRGKLGLLMLLLFAIYRTDTATHTANAFCSTPFRPRQCQRSDLGRTSEGLDFRKLKKSTAPMLSCGLLDALLEAVTGSKSSTGTSTKKFKKATASHILIQGDGPAAKTKLQGLKMEIGNDPFEFGEAAARYSDCSSASKGGDLGEFEPGTMAKEFDDIVFDAQTPIGVVQGPIKTEFGYHLVLVKERTE